MTTTAASLPTTRGGAVVSRTTIDNRQESAMISTSTTTVRQGHRHGRLTGERHVDAAGTDWRQVRWFAEGYTGWVMGRSLVATEG